MALSETQALHDSTSPTFWGAFLTELRALL